MSNYFTWMKAQFTGIPATIHAIIANQPEPACDVLGRTAILLAVAWVAFKITKAVSK